MSSSSVKNKNIAAVDDASQGICGGAGLAGATAHQVLFAYQPKVLSRDTHIRHPEHTLTRVIFYFTEQRSIIDCYSKFSSVLIGPIASI